MKIKMSYAQYTETKEIWTLEDATREMKAFATRHGLTDACWINFRIDGEFNVRQEVGYTHQLEALFGGTKMTTLQNKKERLKEIESITKPLYEESTKLNDEIQYEEFEDFCNRANKYDWFLEENGCLYIESKYAEDIYLNLLYPHGSYNNKEYTIRLYGDDGNIYFGFDDDDTMIAFIEKHNINITNTNEIQNKININRDRIDDINTQTNKLFNLITKLKMMEINKNKDEYMKNMKV